AGTASVSSSRSRSASSTSRRRPTTRARRCWPTRSTAPPARCSRRTSRRRAAWVASTTGAATSTSRSTGRRSWRARPTTPSWPRCSRRSPRSSPRTSRRSSTSCSPCRARRSTSAATTAPTRRRSTPSCGPRARSTGSSRRSPERPAARRPLTPPGGRASSSRLPAGRPPGGRTGATEPVPRWGCEDAPRPSSPNEGSLMTTPALEHDHEHATEPVATVATVTPEPEVPLAERSLLPRVAAELFGTFVLVTAIVVVAAFGALGTQGSRALHVALAGGLALAAMVASFGAVSGAHLNPAVSLGAAIAGRLSWADLAPYVVAQTLGGVAAGGLLRAVVPAELPAATGATDARAFISTTANGFGSHSPIAKIGRAHVTFSTAQVLLVELVVTGVLVAVVLAVTRRPHPSAPLAIGGALTVAILVAAPVSNAA